MINAPTENKPPGSVDHPRVEPAHLKSSRSPQRPRRRGHSAIIIVLFIAAGLIGYVWWHSHQVSADKGTASGPSSNGRRRSGGFGAGGVLPVSVSPAAKGDIAIFLNGLGTVTPLHTVTIRTQVSGQLIQLGFQEGQLVRQGDLLAVIDPRPYEVAREQAQGQLRQAQAQLKTAQLDLQRYETLAQQDSIAKQQVDTARSQVNQYEGLAQTYQAAIDTATLNIAYCHIKAPMDGRVGLRLVDVGNYVTPGDTNGLVSLVQVKPISVLFTLPEDNVGEIAARLREGATLTTDLFDRTQSRQIASGMLKTIDNQMDASTGTFKLRAEFANDDERLFPNQFVNVRLQLNTLHDATVIATSAIERGQQGTFVYVVQPDETVVVKPVTLGPTEGERVAVTAGLSLGDRVVVDGADKLKDGMQVSTRDPGSNAAHTSPSGATGGAEKRRRSQREKTAEPAEKK